MTKHVIRPERENLNRFAQLERERAERFAVIDRMREAFNDVSAEEIERQSVAAARERRRQGGSSAIARTS